MAAGSESHLREVVVTLNLDRHLSGHRFCFLLSPSKEVDRLVDRLCRRLPIGRVIPDRLSHEHSLAHEAVNDEIAVPDLHLYRLGRVAPVEYGTGRFPLWTLRVLCDLALHALSFAFYETVWVCFCKFELFIKTVTIVKPATLTSKCSLLLQSSGTLDSDSCGHHWVAGHA